jgi:UDP-glucose 6-dehydrogenase
MMPTTKIVIFEPRVLPLIPSAQVTLPGCKALECADSIPGCLADSHCCVVVTEGERFKALTPEDFVKHMATPVIVDARRIFDPRQFRPCWNTTLLV